MHETERIKQIKHIIVQRRIKRNVGSQAHARHAAAGPGLRGAHNDDNVNNDDNTTSISNNDTI